MAKLSRQTIQHVWSRHKPENNGAYICRHSIFLFLTSVIFTNNFLQIDRINVISDTLQSSIKSQKFYQRYSGFSKLVCETFASFLHSLILCLSLAKSTIVGEGWAGGISTPEEHPVYSRGEIEFHYMQTWNFKTLPLDCWQILENFVQWSKMQEDDYTLAKISMFAALSLMYGVVPTRNWLNEWHTSTNIYCMCTCISD